MSAAQPCMAQVNFVSPLQSAIVESARAQVLAESHRHSGLVVALGTDMLRVFGPADGDGGRELVMSCVLACLGHLAIAGVDAETDVCAPMFFDLVACVVRLDITSRRTGRRGAVGAGMTALPRAEHAAEGAGVTAPPCAAPIVLQIDTELKGRVRQRTRAKSAMRVQEFMRGADLSIPTTPMPSRPPPWASEALPQVGSSSSGMLACPQPPALPQVGSSSSGVLACPQPPAPPAPSQASRAGSSSGGLAGPPSGILVACSPPRGLSALEICRRMTERKFRLHGPSLGIVWNKRHDGGVWVALTCSRVDAVMGSEVIENIDGHVSIYVLHQGAPHQTQLVAAKLRERLDKIRDRAYLWEGEFLLEGEYSEEGYAWCH